MGTSSTPASEPAISTQALVVYFGANTVELHYAPGSKTSAKTRVLRLPRDSQKKSDDPNVRLLRTLAAAPALLNALTNALISLDTDGQAAAAASLNSHGRPAIAKATGA